MPTEPKKPRAKRRNYESELRELALYCRLSIDILSEITTLTTDSEHAAGQIATLKAVLARLEKQ